MRRAIESRRQQFGTNEHEFINIETELFLLPSHHLCFISTRASAAGLSNHEALLFNPYIPSRHRPKSKFMKIIGMTLTEELRNLFRGTDLSRVELSCLPTVLSMRIIRLIFKLHFYLCQRTGLLFCDFVI